MGTCQKLLLGLTVIASVTSAHQAVADPIVFTNFGPGQTFNQSAAAAVTGVNFAGGQVIAEAFTATDNFTFSNAQLAMAIFGGTNFLQVVLMANAGGAPGAILE